MYINTVCVSVQSQQPLGHLDAELRRALSPETVQGGNRAPSPAASFTLGRFQVLNTVQQLLKMCIFQNFLFIAVFVVVLFLFCDLMGLIVSSLNVCVPVTKRIMFIVMCFVQLILSFIVQNALRCTWMSFSVLQIIVD